MAERDIDRAIRRLNKAEKVALGRIIRYGFADDYASVRALVFDHKLVKMAPTHRQDLTYVATPMGEAAWKKLQGTSARRVAERFVRRTLR